MAAKKGILFLVGIVGAGSPSTSTPILTARNVDMSGSEEFVDVTNKGSNGWRAGLEGAGVKQMTVSFDGVYEDAAYEATLNSNFLDGTHGDYVITNEDGDEWSGKFQITSYGRAGTYNGEETYSVTLESVGTVTYSAS